MIKTKNFGAVNELKVIGAVSNDCQMVKFNSAPLEGLCREQSSSEALLERVSAIADGGGDKTS